MLTKRVFLTLCKGPRKTLYLCQNAAQMALINKRLTPGEIAAVYYHVFGGCQDWTLLYAIADGIKDKQVYDINRNTVSKWKGMDKITNLCQDLEKRKKEMEQAKEKEPEEDRVRIEKTPILKNSKFVDYSSPAAQQAKLNELVNTAADPGEALDALKVIIQGQKADREAAREGRTVRAYLPQACNDCPLYQKARKKGQK